GVAAVLFTVQWLAARHVADTWQVPDPETEPALNLKIKNQSKPLPVRLDAQARADLREPFTGLAFNGVLADPKMLTLWLLEHQENGRRLGLGEYKPDDLARASAVVEKSAEWHTGMRWV